MLASAGVKVHIALGATDMMGWTPPFDRDQTSPLVFWRGFRWKQELAPTMQTKTTFLPVALTDAPEQSAAASQPMPGPGPAPVIVERSAPGIEVELIGGRRVRFERDVGPETVHRLVALLEGDAP